MPGHGHHLTKAKCHFFRDDDLTQVLHNENDVDRCVAKTKSEPERRDACFGAMRVSPSALSPPLALPRAQGPPVPPDATAHCPRRRPGGALGLGGAAAGRAARPQPPVRQPGAAPAPALFPAAVTITVGPASQAVEKLVELLEAGVTCARIDLTVRAAAALAAADGGWECC